jgi:hypothetical protein
MEVPATCARPARTALATTAASPAPPAALASQGQQGQVILPRVNSLPRPVPMAKDLMERHRTLAQLSFPLRVVPACLDMEMVL